MSNFQPKYTPTVGEYGGSSITYDQRKGHKSGQRVIGTRRTDDGVNECSVPHLPYENWLDPSGNVVPLVVSTNRDPRSRDEKYRYVTIEIRKRKGWMPWDDVPYGLTEQAWHVERDAEQARRRERARHASAAYAKVGVSGMERLAQLSQDNQAELNRILAKLANGTVPAELAEKTDTKPRRGG
jgi:hypothetical protein